MFPTARRLPALILFRACVALRQILAARKRPVIRHVRKAAAGLIAIPLVTCAAFADDLSAMRIRSTLPLRALTAKTAEASLGLKIRPQSAEEVSPAPAWERRDDHQSVGQAQPIRPINTLRVVIAPNTEGELPAETREPDAALADPAILMNVSRAWNAHEFAWYSPAFCHQPLYLEQWRIERCECDERPLVQPLLAGAHFFASVPLLPAKAIIHRPWQPVASRR